MPATTPAKARFAAVNSTACADCGTANPVDPNNGLCATAPTLPPGATAAGADDYDDAGARLAYGPELTSDAAIVWASCVQTAAGDIIASPACDAPIVYLAPQLEELTAAQARQLAQHLTVAADLADTWTRIAER